MASDPKAVDLTPEEKEVDRVTAIAEQLYERINQVRLGDRLVTVDNPVGRGTIFKIANDIAARTKDG